MTKYELFREVTIHICSSLDLALALKNVFPVLSKVVPLDEIRVNVLDTNLHAVKTIAVADGNGAKNLLDAPLVLPMPPRAEAELAGNELEDVRIVGRIEEDRATASIRERYFPDVPESSLLILRLKLDGIRQGALLLRAEGENRYTDQHKRLVSGLNEPFAIAVNNALTHKMLDHARAALAAENEYLTAELRGNREIVGESFGLAKVMDLVSRVAPLNSPVILLGETGVGKEIIADAIHRASPRREGPFIKVNCGAIPGQLIDSELFGHEKGAFTGAVARRIGRFERAKGGTLFLDEIGDLPLEAQVRLLRVLQSKQMERVGGTEMIETDVRIVAATHRDIMKLVQEGKFREDLWYRIGVFPIMIPPLRDRRADIPALVHHFIEQKSFDMGMTSPPPIARGTMERLQAYDWPGNVRELENAVERELILRNDGELTFEGIVGNIEKKAVEAADPDEPPVSLDAAISRHIEHALAYTNGKVSGPRGAAELLGMNPSTLRHRMRKLGIQSRRH